MFVNLNQPTLPLTVSATPTAHAIPSSVQGTVRARILNASGGVLVVKPEISSTTTLTAPVSGTLANQTAMADQTVEMFDLSPNITHISVYSATGTGLAYIQFTLAE